MDGFLEEFRKKQRMWNKAAALETTFERHTQQFQIWI